MLVFHDVTDLRRADQVRRDFVANVSHELRTPLTAIRGYVEALLDDAPGASEAPAGEAREFLEVVAPARPADGATRPRSASTCAAGRRPGATRPRALRSRRDRLGRGTRPARHPGGAPAAGAHRRFADGTAVLGDAAKLHDVLRNLIENASNYSPEGATHRGRGRAQRRKRADRSRRPRAGHSGRRPAAHLRALLSRGPIARARPGRHGSRPLDRAAPGRAARRPRIRLQSPWWRHRAHADASSRGRSTGCGGSRNSTRRQSALTRGSSESEAQTVRPASPTVRSKGVTNVQSSRCPPCNIDATAAP